MFPRRHNDFPVYDVDDTDRPEHLSRANRVPIAHRERHQRHQDGFSRPPPPPVHQEARRPPSPNHHYRRVQQLQNEVSTLRSEASSQSRREKLLLRTVAGYHLAIQENRSIPDPPSRQYAIINHGSQDAMLNIDANESLASSLTLPALNDRTLTHNFLSMMHLSLAGDGSYIQSAMHPGTPARELFLSGSINLSLARINSRCQDTDIKVIFAGINTIFMELLRSCGIISVPPAALPLVRSSLWRPDQLTTSRAPALDVRAPAGSAMNRDQILAYLRSAISSLTPPNPPAPGVDVEDDSGEEGNINPLDYNQG